MLLFIFMMTITKDEVIEVLFEGLDEFNQTLPPEERVPKSLETRLLGEDGSVDSLGLTMFIVSVESKIEQRFGRLVRLVDGLALSESDSPLRTINTLAQHILNQLNAS